MKHEAVILAVGRSPLARSYRGAYRSTRIDDIAAAVVRNLLVRVPGLAPADIEDVIVGCAMPEGEQGYNVARNIALLAGLPVEIGGITVNRFCSSSLDAISQAAMCVASGHGDAFIAGGIESMSHVPMGGFNPSFNENLMREGVPDAYIAMGATAENLARHYAISREEQDRFALASHRKAVSTQTRNGFEQEIIPVEAQDESGRKMIVSRDEGPRADTTIEALANLKPAFARDGTVTAGNSSPLTDGAAFAIVASKRFAKRIGAKPLARIRASAVIGLDPAFMGLGAAHVVPKVLARAKMKMKRIDLIEINEAFAAQSLAVMRELDFEEKKLNVHGGAIALGHPLGASGARILATLINAMRERDAGTGLIAMCVGGGQGAAMVVER